MNDKIKHLLATAYKTDSIEKNKWRIENREQLRKERKEKLKELMVNNKQQTAVEWLAVRRDVLEIEVRLGKLSPIEYAEELTKAEQQAKAMHKEEMVDFGNDLLAQNDTNYIGLPNLAEQYYNETFGE